MNTLKMPSDFGCTEPYFKILGLNLPVFSLALSLYWHRFPFFSKTHAVSFSPRQKSMGDFHYRGVKNSDINNNYYILSCNLVQKVTMRLNSWFTTVLREWFWLLSFDEDIVGHTEWKQTELPKTSTSWKEGLFSRLIQFNPDYMNWTEIQSGAHF